MSSRRLRGSQPLSGDMPPTSSSSSLSSGRLDRPARSESRKETTLTKSQSPNSSDDADAAERAERETRLTRQQKREESNLEVKDDPKDDDEQDDEDGDGEVTRCVCGQTDYPGPPVPLAEGGRTHGSRDGSRLASLAAAEGLPEDAGGLFIQCDKCHVWQHGGCVGIMEEAATPENYYCEGCQPELHRVLTGARGQRYSRYLPIVEPGPARTPRRSSGEKDTESRSDKDVDKKERPGMLYSGKRRSTMNSRTVYDEEEMLRKAIEESKNGANRKGKRARDDDSEETKNDLKRRRTGVESEQPRPGAQQSVDPSDDESGEGRSRSAGENKKSRSVAAQAQRERERVEREQEKEAERAQAAGRRSGRAEKRRAEEAEALEESTKSSFTTRNVAVAKPSRSQSSSKVTQGAIPAASISHKKKTTSKRGRVGRNQYTKDRDQASDKNESPRASHSRGSEEAGNGQDGGGAERLINGAKTAKVKNLHPGRTSMNDLRKRAAGILEYITRTQVELAGTKSPSAKDRSGSSTPSLRGKGTQANGQSKLSQQHETSDETSGTQEGGGGVDEFGFKSLSSLEMMDVLTRELVHWQKDWGKYGEKS